MPKWLKMLAGVLLLPVCASAVLTLLRVVRHSSSADTFWVAFAGGAASWVALFLLLPKPMWVYVFGHELTHALWVWLFGGRVHRFKVSSKGGEVAVSRTNFLIVLAPYFFPLYAVLIVAGYVVGNLIWGWHPYLLGFHLSLGAAYAFHVTLTGHILRAEQSDVTQQGWIFSAAVVFLGNILVLLLGIPLLAERPPVVTALRWWFEETVRLSQGMAGWF